MVSNVQYIVHTQDKKDSKSYQVEKSLSYKYSDGGDTIVITQLRLEFKFPAKIDLAGNFLKYQPSDDDSTNHNCFQIKKQVV